MKQKLKDGG